MWRSELTPPRGSFAGVDRLQAISLSGTRQKQTVQNLFGWITIGQPVWPHFPTRLLALSRRLPLNMRPICPVSDTFLFDFQAELMALTGGRLAGAPGRSLLTSARYT